MSTGSAARVEIAAAARAAAVSRDPYGSARAATTTPICWRYVERNTHDRSTTRSGTCAMGAVVDTELRVLRDGGRCGWSTRR